jgi:hypothetical protein
MIDWKALESTNYSQLGCRFETSIDSIGLTPLFSSIMKSGKGCITRFYKEGYSDKAYEFMLSKIKELGGRKIYENIVSENSEEGIYIWDDAIVEITFGKNKLVSIGAASCNNAITAACKETMTMFNSNTKKGYVFAITRGHSGNLAITRIGFAGSSLERGNYTDIANKDYDYIIDDLKSKDPSGRVVILDGPTGTGKTHMVRAILMDVPNAMFVIVPPNMVASIGGPELIPLLLRTKEDYGKKGPIILVLEDADQCLAPRAADNMSSISSILNLGDGIFGSLFNVRIIATTNAKAKDIDFAIIRDMRLSKRISIQPIPYKNADAIYKRLFNDDSKEMPKPEADDRDRMKPLNEKTTFSLAEIYKAARDNGWRPLQTTDADDDKKEDLPPRFYRDQEGMLDFVD